MSYPLPPSLVVQHDVPTTAVEGGYREHRETAGRFQAQFRWWTQNRVHPLWLAIIIALAASGFVTVGGMSPLFPMAVGASIIALMFIYTTFERILLTVQNGVLHVRTGPFPLPFSKAETVHLDEVRTFSAEDFGTCIKREWPKKDDVTESWWLTATLDDSSRVVLIPNAKKDVILYLAWQLNEQAYPPGR